MLLTEQTTISNLLSDYAATLKESINQLTKISFNEVITYDLDCTNLTDFGNKPIQCEKTLKFIDEIERQNDLPAVYWFEIISDHTAKELYDSVIDLKKISDRNMPAHKKGFSKWTSRILYVGKVKQNLAGRMLLHFGYNIKPSVQGLQLCHWPNKEGLNLRLNVIYLPKNLDVLAGIFELQLAKHLTPIIGKHK